jgi:hypothetical protein
MRVGLLDHEPGLSAYIGEILTSWGVTNSVSLSPERLAKLTPTSVAVLVLPAGAAADSIVSRSVLAYLQLGGTVLSLLPEGALADALGIVCGPWREGPQRLRLSGEPMAGLAGESLPVVGPAATWVMPAPTSLPEAYLYPAASAEDEGPGIVRASVGTGTLLGLAFDLPRAVLMLRQGDPAHREECGRGDEPARPTHLACALGGPEPGWVPFADLLGRVLVELVASLFPAPLPLSWHLPDGAPGIILYSGDEDGAEVEWNRTQFDEVAAGGGRMNLYVIPGNTNSTPADVAAYRLNHDVGPHPNLRPLDGEPVRVRVEDMARQIGEFEQRFSTPARSLRNHCVAWAGYLEPVRAMAACGVRMEGNYFCSTFLYGRDYAPYAAFGAALPLRFCDPAGELLDVHQQHTHTMDDVYFGPEWVDYSYRIQPPQWEVILGRVLDDVVTRFHVPHAVCIHPSNWVRFSRNQGLALLRQAATRQLPVYSFDQWLDFWERRLTWRCESLQCDHIDGSLRLSARFDGGTSGVAFVLPGTWRGRYLRRVDVSGGRSHGRRIRFGSDVEMIHVDGGEAMTFEAIYDTGRASPRPTSRTTGAGSRT